MFLKSQRKVVLLTILLLLMTDETKPMPKLGIGEKTHSLQMIGEKRPTRLMTDEKTHSMPIIGLVTRK
jgi:hypothetical protein